MFSLAGPLGWFLYALQFVFVGFLCVIVTILLLRAFDARRQPRLERWHRVRLKEEFEAGKCQLKGFSDYLTLETRLFRELEARVCSKVESGEANRFNRYSRDSVSFPGGWEQDWNQSYELHPEQLRGGALLLHGLTDSPYSMRWIARVLQRQGYYVLVPRMPGHGTTPSSLLHVRMEDWTAVVRQAARRVRKKVGTKGPFVLGGYSNGGALALEHTLHTIEESGAERLDRLYLISPAVGVTAFAVFAAWHRALAWLPYFEKFRWTSIHPEYDPFKYNSFPKMVGHQMRRLTGTIKERIQTLARLGQLDRLPPILAFQSLVDSTVGTRPLIRNLFDYLPNGDHELVMFDINRHRSLKPFLKQPYESLLDQLLTQPDLTFTMTLVTNLDKESNEVGVRTRAPGQSIEDQQPLGLKWPNQVYSLSHVAIPFPAQDPIYGDGESSELAGNLPLGALQPRGEKGVLMVPPQQLMRLRYNPFFTYLEQRIIASLG